MAITEGGTTTFSDWLRVRMGDNPGEGDGRVNYNNRDEVHGAPLTNVTSAGVRTTCS